MNTDNRQQMMHIKVSMERNQLFHLPSGVQSLQVDEGILWLAQNGEDVLLEAGAVLDSQHVGRDAIFSAVAGCAVIDLGLPRFDAAHVAQRTLHTLTVNRP